MGNSQSSTGEDDFHAVGPRSPTHQADEAVAEMFEAEGLSSQIRLMIRCRKLADMDAGSRNVSDPFVVVYLRDAQTGALLELGRTEVICNNLNPTFVKSIRMVYRFEEVQHLVFRVYDVDTFGLGFDNSNSQRLDLSKQDFIGECECDLASIMGRHGQTHTMHLKRADMGGERGQLTVTGEEAPNQNASVRLALGVNDLPKSVLSSAPDVFLILERVKEVTGGQQAFPCYRTEVVKQTCSPMFKPFEIGVQQLCNANFQQPIRIKAFTYDRSGGGRHRLMGHVDVSLDGMLSKQKGARYPLLDPKRQSSQGLGSIALHSAELIARPSFLDYIRGGCELNFMVAIDFTASNGNPADVQSLHYINPYGTGQQYETNAYIQAILAVGGVLEYYDTDKMFPVFGFGGKVGPQVQHCFALNGNDSNPEVPGITGVLQAYQQAIRTYPLAGPTFFSEIIQRAAASATHCSQQDQRYQVLLIITDGIINDMDATISSIVYASTLPLSILIVGVGSANFDAMDVLDGDKHRLGNAASGYASRDIVQFVPIRDYILPTGQVNRTALARALLDEIPGQLLSYMQMRGMPPNAPIRRMSSVSLS